MLRPAASLSFFIALVLAAPGARVVHATPTPTSESAPVSAAAFRESIEKGLKRVPEFEFLKEAAARLGVKVWLFGGSAASFAHYVKWDLLREKGDTRFQKERFTYHYFDIYRSTQDMDIVIDGTEKQAEELSWALAEKFPYLQGSKSVWEVRLLKQASRRGDKEALLDNPNFLGQHTDSNSTGMIEISKPGAGQPVIRDVRDWSSTKPSFLRDVLDGKLTYYYSPATHVKTQRYRDGLNPPIFSVIRLLTKAFNYELELSDQAMHDVRQVIAEFDPNRDLAEPRARAWLERNAPKLIQNAVNIEYAVGTLDQLGLREKLRALGDPKEERSMAWWMNKEPLKTFAIGQGKGQTARELGLDLVAHETDQFLSYESITRAHTGAPNALISRRESAGESAAHGNGFYVRIGREGARGTGLTIRFHLNPEARQGSDFLLSGDFLVVLNKAALRVIPESTVLGVHDYLSLLASSGIGEEDRGLQEKLRLRMRSVSARKISAAEAKEINQLVTQHLDQVTDQTQFFFQEFLSMLKSFPAKQRDAALERAVGLELMRFEGDAGLAKLAEAVEAADLLPGEVAAELRRKLASPGWPGKGWTIKALARLGILNAEDVRKFHQLIEDGLTRGTQIPADLVADYLAASREFPRELRNRETETAVMIESALMGKWGTAKATIKQAIEAEEFSQAEVVKSLRRRIANPLLRNHGWTLELLEAFDRNRNFLFENALRMLSGSHIDSSALAAAGKVVVEAATADPALRARLSPAIDSLRKLLLTTKPGPEFAQEYDPVHHLNQAKYNAAHALGRLTSISVEAQHAAVDVILRKGTELERLVQALALNVPSPLDPQILERLEANLRAGKSSRQMGEVLLLVYHGAMKDDLIAEYDRAFSNRPTDWISDPAAVKMLETGYFTPRAMEKAIEILAGSEANTTFTRYSKRIFAALAKLDDRAIERYSRLAAAIPDEWVNHRLVDWTGSFRHVRSNIANDPRFTPTQRARLHVVTEQYWPSMVSHREGGPRPLAADCLAQKLSSRAGP